MIGDMSLGPLGSWVELHAEDGLASVVADSPVLGPLPSGVLFAWGGTAAFPSESTWRVMADFSATHPEMTAFYIGIASRTNNGNEVRTMRGFNLDGAVAPGGLASALFLPAPHMMPFFVRFTAAGTTVSSMRIAYAPFQGQNVNAGTLLSVLTPF